MADAFASGGDPQPPAKKCKRTQVSSERGDVHPTTEEAQPSSVADLIIPPELVPIKKGLTASIEASGSFDEHFKVVHAYANSSLVWRRSQVSRMQERRVYNVLQGFLAVYHPEVLAAWFRDGKINAARAEKLYVAYCQNALPLTRLLNDCTLVHIAWAIREQQQSR